MTDSDDAWLEYRAYQPQPRPENLHLQYTNADDGIWLTCWTEPVAEAYVVNLGFAPTIAEIVAAADKHVSEKHR